MERWKTGRDLLGKCGGTQPSREIYLTGPGTELSFKDIIFNSFWYDVYKYARGEGFLAYELEKNEKAGNSDPGRECTAVVFTNTDVGVVIGRNTDDGPVQDYVCTMNRCGEPLLIRRPAQLGYSTMDTPLAGINEKGLAMSGASTYYREEKEGGEIFPANVHDLVMRRCSTVDEAVEMIMRYNTFTSRSGNTAIVDGNGDAAIVEKSLMECGILRPKEGEEYAFTTAGVAVHPEMKKLMDDSTDSYKFNLKRHTTVEGNPRPHSSIPCMQTLRRTSAYIKHRHFDPGSYGAPTKKLLGILCRAWTKIPLLY